MLKRLVTALQARREKRRYDRLLKASVLVPDFEPDPELDAVVTHLRELVVGAVQGSAFAVSGHLIMIVGARQRKLQIAQLLVEHGHRLRTYLEPYLLVSQNRITQKAGAIEIDRWNVAHHFMTGEAVDL